MPEIDLIIKNATLPDGRENIDILCSDGYIVDLGKNIKAEFPKNPDIKIINNFTKSINKLKIELVKEISSKI